MLKYLKTVILGILIGIVFGTVTNLLVAFVVWDEEILKEIFTPIRVSAAFFFVFANAYYFTDKYD